VTSARPAFADASGGISVSAVEDPNAIAPEHSPQLDGPPRPEIVRLREGSAVTIRPVRAEDEAPLRTFLNELCPEARRLRFFTGAADMRTAAHWAADAPAGTHGLLAHDEMGALVAHASYAQLDSKCAEVAVEVADHLHGRGLGTLLIERLAAIAEERGIAQFVAEVLPDNCPMLGVFRNGFDARVAFHDGVEKVVLPTAAWRLARARFEVGSCGSERIGSCGSERIGSCGSER
jgi:GNAT superfamily N-acetyltransferase